MIRNDRDIELPPDPPEYDEADALWDEPNEDELLERMMEMKHGNA